MAEVLKARGRRLASIIAFTGMVRSSGLEGFRTFNYYGGTNHLKAKGHQGTAVTKRGLFCALLLGHVLQIAQTESWQEATTLALKCAGCLAHFSLERDPCEGDY